MSEPDDRLADPDVEVLHFEDYSFKNELCEEVAELANLKMVSFTNCCFSEKGAENLCKSDSIEELHIDIPSKQLTHKMFEELSKIKMLRKLFVNVKPATRYENLAPIGNMRGLEMLSVSSRHDLFSRTPAVSDKEVCNIVANKPNLKELSLDFITSLDYTGIRFLENIPALEKLSLSHTSIYDPLPKYYLNKLRGLKHLNLDGVFILNTTVSNYVFRNIAPIESIDVTNGCVYKVTEKPTLVMGIDNVKSGVTWMPWLYQTEESQANMEAHFST